MIPPILQVVLMAWMYLFCALMFHRNEELQHPDDQIGDPVVARALALLWPMVVVGVGMGLLARLAVAILIPTFRLLARALDGAARLWLQHRNPPCPNPSPK